MEIEYEKNKELKEKQDLQLDFERQKNDIKIQLLNHEHILKMQRLNKQEEIAKLGSKIEKEEEED